MKMYFSGAYLRFFKGEGSHFITPMLLTRWVCLHPLEVIFFRMSSARWEEGGGGGYKTAGKDVLHVDSSDLRLFAT